MEFAIFFIIVFFYSWELHAFPNWRKIFLLLSSYYFYSTLDLRFLPILILSPFLNFLLGLWLGTEKSVTIKKYILFFCVFCNLFLLGVFKYYNFFLENIQIFLQFTTSYFSNDAVQMQNTTNGFSFLNYEFKYAEWTLPLGISFFTFQGISYLVDIYRKELDYNNSVLDVLLYIAFFPHLVAGPIVKASEFIPQLKQKVDSQSIPLVSSFILICFGLAKKIIIANHIGTDFVDPIFENPMQYSSIEVLFAAYAYSVQIFCDFSAYSDMAIGFAALLGYQFPINFNQPYQATSLQDFWRRWHISLSQWLKIYLYQSLGGNKKGELKTYRNLFITMFLGGLWHGASWNFLIWGSLHGLGLGLERFIKNQFSFTLFTWSYLGKFLNLLKILFVFHFVTLTWIFFRAPSFDKSKEFLITLFSFLNFSQISEVNETAVFQIFNPFYFTLLTVGMGLHFINWNKIFIFYVQISENLKLKTSAIRILQSYPTLIFALFSAMVFTILTAFKTQGVAPFIYFRF